MLLDWQHLVTNIATLFLRMAAKVDMLFRTITVDMLICRGRLNEILYALLYATLIRFMHDFKYKHHKLRPYIAEQKVRNKQFFTVLEQKLNLLRNILAMP